MDPFRKSADWVAGCEAGERYIQRAYECGVFKPTPIHANPHTDTFATLAEYRTAEIAVRATFDDVDGEYELTIIVRGRSWRLHPEDIDQMRDWLRRIVERHPPEKFVCRVDY